MNIIKFGTAGSPDQFHEQGGKSSLEMPKFLRDLGLNAYEYQCGRGVKISQEGAENLGEHAKKNGISLSIHAPYFTNISSDEQERIDKSIDYIMQSVNAAKQMGATRVVVHMGSIPKYVTRREALKTSKDTMRRALLEMDNAGCGNITLCPETMGKLGQMGTLEEVLELCKMDERLIPTIDFGHLNSRGLGSLVNMEDFEAIIDDIENKLGKYRVENFHSHFSKIEFTKSGEKRHTIFSDEEWGPEFAPLSIVLAKRNLTPTIICESAGTQAIDALIMKDLYEKAKEELQ